MKSFNYHNILSTEYIKAIPHHDVFKIHVLKTDAQHYVRTQSHLHSSTLVAS